MIVIGGGASAIDLAGLLYESGAKVQLVARQPSLEIYSRLQLPRPLWERIKWPISTIGAGWRSYFCAYAPLLFHYLPKMIRLRVVKKHLGPAAGWFMKDRIKNVVCHLGFRLTSAEVCANRVKLKLIANDRTERQLEADHIIAATGYHVDLRRLPFLTDKIRQQLKLLENTPVLSSHFESSLPGLYFVGPASANSFGPVMRFAAGAKFAARRVSRHLAAK